MAFIESSRKSPLAGLAPPAAEPAEREEEIDDLDEPEEEPSHEDHSPKQIKQNLIDWIDSPNIARDIDQATLEQIGMLVVREYDLDEESRAEWKDEAQKALDFAVQKAEPKQYPWVDSSNVIFPLITSASMQFAARAYPAIIQNRNVVKGIVWGDDKGTPATQNGKPDGAPKLHPDGSPVWLAEPGEKKKRADKIGEHMSWQLLEQLEEWEPQTDAMLHQLPIVGGAVRKTFRDPREDCNRSLLVPLMNLVWNFHAPSFEKAPRHTEIQEFYPHEVEELERDGETFLPIMYGPGDVGQEDGDSGAPAPDSNDTEAPHTFLEQHRRYDLDRDGYAEPLIITVHRRSSKVVRIVARYEEDGIVTDEKTGELKRIDPVDSYTLYPFLPNPKGGSYPVGFGHLLKPLNEAINTTINQMFDAGHLQIAGGGFIGTGLSLHAGTTNFSIGEFKPVNNKGGSIRDNIFPIPWPGPSEVLFQLLGFLVGAAKEVASIQGILTGDAALANASPTTMLALVEQGVKVYTAIHKRIYRALKSEFAKLYRLNRIYLTDDERYRIGDTWRQVTPEDYRLGGGVEPIADPTMVTDMQRLGRAAAVMDAAKNNPLVNPLEATRRYFEALQIDRIDGLIPDKMPPPQTPPDQAVAQQEVQIKGQKLQLEMAALQSKVGLERAQELQAYTMAMLNFNKARSEMSQPQIAWMESQLNLMRLHIEALNTTVKAASVDAAFHGHNTRHEGHMADVRARAKETADEQPSPGPANLGGGANPAAGLAEPGGAGNAGNGIPAMAPPPGNAGLPAIPGTPQPGIDQGGGG
jgi:chaperonin GroES